MVLIFESIVVRVLCYGDIGRIATEKRTLAVVNLACAAQP